jgi:hypothetical protein
VRLLSTRVFLITFNLLFSVASLSWLVSLYHDVNVFFLPNALKTSCRLRSYSKNEP